MLNLLTETVICYELHFNVPPIDGAVKHVHYYSTVKKQFTLTHVKEVLPRAVFSWPGRARIRRRLWLSLQGGQHLRVNVLRVHIRGDFSCFRGLTFDLRETVYVTGPYMRSTDRKKQKKIFRKMSKQCLKENCVLQEESHTGLTWGLLGNLSL